MPTKVERRWEGRTDVALCKPLGHEATVAVGKETGRPFRHQQRTRDLPSVVNVEVECDMVALCHHPRQPWRSWIPSRRGHAARVDNQIVASYSSETIPALESLR